MSEDSNGSDNPVYKYRKVAFKRKQPTVEIDDSDNENKSTNTTLRQSVCPPLPVHQPASMSDSDDQESPLFQYKKVAFQRKQPEPDSDESSTDCQDHQSPFEMQSQCSLRAQLDSNDEDSDSDCESKPVPPSSKSAVEIALESDDEDALPVKPLASYLYMDPKQHAESLRTIVKARTAAMILRSAQAYHAEDVCIPIDVPRPEVLSVSTAMARSVLDHPPLATNFGRSITVKMRTTIIINNIRSGETLEDVMVIKEREPIQNLMDRFRKQKELSEETNIVFRFDDGIMDMTKTPVHYDLDDDELIDAEYNSVAVMMMANRKPAVAERASKKGDLGPALFIKLRTVNGTKELSNEVFKMHENEPFQVLVDQYRKKNNIMPNKEIQFSFEGILKTNQTPANVEMESDDIIDVVVK